MPVPSVAPGTRPMHRRRMPADQGWVAKGPLRRYPLRSCSYRCSGASSHFPQHRGACWHDRETGRRRGKHQPPAQLWILMRELPRDATSPGHAGDVDLRIAKLRDETGAKPRRRRWAIWQRRRRRTADTGHIKDDCRRARECFREVLRQLPVGPNSVEQQQRRLQAVTVPDGNLENCLSITICRPRSRALLRFDCLLWDRQTRKSPELQQGRDGLGSLATRVPQDIRW